MLKMLLACLVMAWTPCLAQEAQPPAHDPQAEHAATQPKAEPAKKAPYPFTPVAKADVVGTGARAMVLVPDVRYPGEIFLPFMERNKAHYTMHAITLPGYGGTAQPPPKPEGEFGAWENNAALAIAQYIQEKGLQKPIVVGLGLGGRPVCILAAEHADLVGEVILLNTQFFWPLPTIENPTPDERVEFIKKEMLPRMARIPEAEWLRRKKLNMPQVCIDEKRSEEIAAMAMRTGREAEDGYVVDFAARDLRPLLPGLSMPVMLLESTGLGDAALTFRERQEALARAHAAMIPAGKVVIYRQTRHFAFEDRPVEFDAAIASFLKGEQPPDLDPAPVPYNNVPTVDAPPPTGRIDPSAPSTPPTETPANPNAPK